MTDFEAVYRQYFSDVELYLRAICHDGHLAEELTDSCYLRLMGEGGESVTDFEAVYRQYFSDVELYLRAICHDGHLAEELTEQVFFQALKALPEFRGECDIRTWLCAMARNAYLSHLRKARPTVPIEEVSIPDPKQKALPEFRGECDIRTWLCAMARNAYLSHLRKARPTVPIEEVSIPDPKQAVEEQVLDRERALAVHRVLHSLPEPYKEVFTLRVFGQLSFGDIGGLFGKTAKVLDRERALAVHRVLHSLPEPYKEVFTLRVFGQLSFGDIGGLFGKTANWACVTYHRAKEKIQLEMEEYV